MKRTMENCDKLQKRVISLQGVETDVHSISGAAQSSIHFIVIPGNTSFEVYSERFLGNPGIVQFYDEFLISLQVWPNYFCDTN